MIEIGNQDKKGSLALIRVFLKGKVKNINKKDTLKEGFIKELKNCSNKVISKT